MSSVADTARGPVDRTSLSWQRTSAHSSLVALVAAATALQLGEPLVGIIAAGLAMATLLIGATTPRVRRSTAEHRDPWALMVRTLLVLLASSIVALMLIASVALDG